MVTEFWWLKRDFDDLLECWRSISFLKKLQYRWKWRNRKIIGAKALSTANHYWPIFGILKSMKNGICTQTELLPNFSTQFHWLIFVILFSKHNHLKGLRISCNGFRRQIDKWTLSNLFLLFSSQGLKRNYFTLFMDENLKLILGDYRALRFEVNE